MALAPEQPSDPNQIVEERPTGPLNVDSGLSGTPADDVTAGDSEEYIDAFSWRTVIGALFIGFIMMPGAIYLSLIAGQGMGPAAEWVTIILFMEVARRSYQTLKKQEIFLLYYIGASLTSQVGALALTGGAFANLIMLQYVINSPYAQSAGITKGISESSFGGRWIAPVGDSAAIAARTFISAEWLPAIALLMVVQVLSRMNSWGLGYALFRITSDIERLPFPLAPIAAEGATALAESSAQKEGWRWRIFSIGAMMGIGWGALYVLIPAVTGLIFAKPIVIVTNPFIDLTQNTQKILPAALTGLGTDLGQILIGFVLPLPIVIGSFIASIGCHIVANPFLYKAGILSHWTPGIDVTQTQVVNQLDFWLSFSIGTAAIVAIVGIFSVTASLAKMRRQRAAGTASLQMSVPKGRGDIPIWVSLALFVVSTIGYIYACHYLVPNFPLWILIFFGFVWTPINSYINARMIGLAGQVQSLPYVKEASFMFSGYSKVDIWFAPIPLNDYGGMAQQFRTIELTKTKFVSIVKAELLMLPIMLICSFLFWSFIWKLAPIPSSGYPYAQKFWPVHAQSQVLWYTANNPEGNSFLREALNPTYIGIGGALAAVSFAAISLSGLPTLLFYGLVSGVQAVPAFAIPQLIGALLGRFYFEKRYGMENWRAYAPVLVAGYYCGMGLIGMGSVALALLSKSVSSLPY